MRTALLILSLALTALMPVSRASAEGYTPTVLITGSNRGIGLALTQDYVQLGWHVIATCRDPDHADALKALANGHALLSIEALDVADNAAIERLAARYREQPIDVLINNAGVLGDLAGQAPARFNADEFSAVLRVNSYAPLRISMAFLPSIVASRQKKIVALSSFAGSIGAAQGPGGAYFYRMSKSALNMGMHLLQNDLRPQGVIVSLISPGPVDTDMNRQYRRGAPAPTQILAPSTSAAAIIQLIARLTPAMGGLEYEYDGHEDPW